MYYNLSRAQIIIHYNWEKSLAMPINAVLCICSHSFHNKLMWRFFVVTGIFFFCFPCVYFLIGGKLLYSVVLVCALQQWKPIITIYVYISLPSVSSLPHSPISPLWAPCVVQQLPASCVTRGSVCMSGLLSQLLPPLLPQLCPQVCFLHCTYQALNNFRCPFDI